jgi:AcrR family transcriptional regulator
MSKAKATMAQSEAAPPVSAKGRQILDGARQVFLAQGFDGASMNEIARIAGVSKGTLYVYFESKQALFAAIVTEDKQRTVRTLFELDPDNKDVGAVLAKLAYAYLDFLLVPDHVASIRTVIGVGEKFPEVGAALYEAGPHTGAQRIAEYLDLRVRDGILRIADTELAAFQFMGMLQMPSFLPMLIGSYPPPDAKRRKMLVDTAVRLFLAGYAVEKATPAAEVAVRDRVS